MMELFTIFDLSSSIVGMQMKKIDIVAIEVARGSAVPSCSPDGMLMFAGASTWSSWW